jgi:hypothetical protein
MALAKEANSPLRIINNHGKQTQDVTTEHAKIKGFIFNHSGIAAAKTHLSSAITSQPYLRFEIDGFSREALATGFAKPHNALR